MYYYNLPFLVKCERMVLCTCHEKKKHRKDASYK